MSIWLYQNTCIFNICCHFSFLTSIFFQTSQTFASAFFWTNGSILLILFRLAVLKKKVELYLKLSNIGQSGKWQCSFLFRIAFILIKMRIPWQNSDNLQNLVNAILFINKYKNLSFKVAHVHTLLALFFFYKTPNAKYKKENK